MVFLPSNIFMYGNESMVIGLTSVAGFGISKCVDDHR